MIALLCLINVGSSTALAAIISIGIAAIVISYIIPITSSSASGYTTSPSPSGRGLRPLWPSDQYVRRLVRHLHLRVRLLPTTIPVTAENMNYAGPVILGLVFIAVMDWLIRGKDVFKGPLRKK